MKADLKVITCYMVSFYEKITLPCLEIYNPIKGGVSYIDIYNEQIVMLFVLVSLKKAYTTQINTLFLTREINVKV